MEYVTITVIGSGDASSSGGRLASAYLLQSSSMGILVDCGPTTLLGLKKSQLPVSFIDCIMVTHFHGDHFGGIPFLLLDARQQKRTKALTLVTPPGGEEKIRNLCELMYPGTDLLEGFPVHFQEYDRRVMEFGEKIKVEAFPVEHKKETQPHGLRIAMGEKVIAFSGDSGWSENLLKLSANSDLFFCECTMFDHTMQGHLSYKELLLLNKKITCKRILLTHLGEEILSKLDMVRLGTTIDGMVIRI